MMGGAEASQAKNFIEDALGDFTLAQLRESQIAAIAGEHSDDVGVMVESSAFGGDVIRNDKVGILGDQFFPGILGHVVRLRSESDDEPITLCSRGFGQNIRRWLEANCERLFVSLHFLGLRFGGPIVGDGGGENRDG
jgi:hypothetical protein